MKVLSYCEDIEEILMRIFWGQSPPSRSSFLRSSNFPTTKASMGMEARVTPLKLSLILVHFNVISSLMFYSVSLIIHVINYHHSLMNIKIRQNH